MKKRTMIFTVALLLVTMIVNSACAYVKPYTECKAEFDKAMTDLYVIASVRDTCQDYIDAFNDGDLSAMNIARSTLINAGLLSQDHSSSDLEYIKALHSDYANEYMDKAIEYTPTMKNYFYWGENLKIVDDAMVRAKNENIPIVPFPWDCSYTSDAMGEFQDGFFDESKNLTGSVGNIYFVEATVYDAYPDKGIWALRYKDKNGYVHRIGVGLPNVEGIPKEDISEMPDVGENGYFFLVYLGTTNDGIRTFFLSINDAVIEAMREAYPEIMPGDE